MSALVKHRFVSVKPEQPDPTIIGPNEWNDDHTFIGSTGGPAGLLLQKLRRSANPSVNDYEFASDWYLVADDYNFPAMSPGGNLSVGNNSIILPYVPLGISGTDTNHYLRISGGVGAAETVLITGGSAVSGNPTPQTIIVNCANTHSGAWIISSASGGLQEAINVAASTSGTSNIAPQIVISKPLTVYNTVTVPGINSYASISIRGMSKNVLAIQRDQSFSNGNLLDLKVGSPLNVKISDMLILEAPFDGSWWVTGGTTIIANQCPVLLRSVRILNPYLGINLIGSNESLIDDINIGWNTAILNAITPEGGILLGGASVSAPSAGGTVICNSTVSGTSTTNVLPVYGLIITSYDGLLIHNCSFNRTQYGIDFFPQTTNGSSGQITGIQICNCDIDGPTNTAIFFQGSTGSTILGISIINCSIGMYPVQPGVLPGATGNGIDVDPSSNLQEITLIANNIFWPARHGISLANTSMVRAIVSDNMIWSPNMANHVFGTGIAIGPGVNGVSITGNMVGNFDGQGHATQGLVFQGTSNNVIVENNNLKDTPIPLSFAGIGTNYVVGNNVGVDDTIPTVASGASITAPVNPCFLITGTVTVTTIAGGWIGRRIRILKKDAGSLTIGGGGNIPGTHTLAQNGGLDLVYDGTGWF